MKRKRVLNNNLLIINAHILPSNNRDCFFGWIEIEGTKIVEVGHSSTYTINKKHTVINADGGIVMPGLVNTHTHTHSSLTRGSAEGMVLDKWISIIEKEQKEMDYETAYIAALGSYYELLLSGTTIVNDMCILPEASAQAALDIGIKAIISPYVADTKDFTPSLLDTERIIKKYNSSFSHQVRIWVGLHDLESCSDQQIRNGIELAKKYRVGIHIHNSETNYNVCLTKNRTGKSPIEYLHDLGLFEVNTLLAHCVWVSEKDIDIMRSNKVGVSHCPQANLKIASGIAPVVEMMNKGVPVSLATDGAKANNRLDMFETMKLTSLIHKGSYLDAKVLPPKQVLSMATKIGSKILHFNSGEIRCGKNADLIILNSKKIHLYPLVPSAIETNIIHSAMASDVQTVIVDGKVVVRDRKLQTMDPDLIKKKYFSSSSLLAKKI